MAIGRLHCCTMHPRTFLVTVLMLAFLVSYWSGCSKTPMAVFMTHQGEVKVKLKVATTPDQRERGLMFETTLPENQGMLFVFEDEEQPRHFWMKHTFVSLDIVFIDTKGVVVDILEHVPVCPYEPCPVYTSQIPSRFALELKAGFVHRHRIEKGSRVKIFY